MRKSAAISIAVGVSMLNGAVAGSHTAAGYTEVPNIRRPAATIELPAVRMDDGWQAMDSTAAPTRPVTVYPAPKNRVMAAAAAHEA
jgi:hypothetical protein